MLQKKVLEKMLWYLRRARSMTTPELAHRIFEVQRRWGSKYINMVGKFRLPRGGLPTFPINYRALEDISNECESEWEEFWRHAKFGEWEFLGVRWPKEEFSPNNELWSRDPVTKLCWPTDIYCFDIPYRHAKDIGDVKYIWEINRLQFLPPIAALSRFRKDKEMAQWCISCLDSWIKSNKPFSGIVYASGIELAVRVVSIIMTITLIGQENIPDDCVNRLREILHAHAYWLERFPSRFSSANNHLVSEATALYILGILMPDLPRASHYKEYGRKTLSHEINKQIHSDGVGAEQSPTYTAFTLEWYAIACAVSRANFDDLADQVSTSARRASEFLLLISDDHGSYPRYGDDDEGRVILSCKASEEKYLQSIAALFLGRESETFSKGRHLRDVFCDQAEERVQRHGQSSDIDIEKNTFIPGGYTVFKGKLRGKKTILLFDHGPLGYLSIAAHGHADALAIWLNVENMPILVDSGTYLYHAGGAERDYFRGTSAHNTLTLNDENQSLISGPFNWATKATAWVENVDDPSMITAYHDGFLKKFNVLHRRTVQISHNWGIEIKDELVGVPLLPSAVVKIRYFLDADISCMAIGENAYSLSGGEQRSECVRMIFEGAGISVDLIETAISPSFGRKSKAKCLVVTTTAEALAKSNVATRIEV